MKELLTLEKLTAWLETRDPNEKYQVGSNSDCLIARYLTCETGHSVSVGIGNASMEYGHKSANYPAELDVVAWGYGVTFHSHPISELPWADEWRALNHKHNHDESLLFCKSDWCTMGKALSRARLLSKED